MEEVLDNSSTGQSNFQGQFQQQQQLPNATATLVLGICSIVICIPGFIMGIIGVVLHKKDKLLYESNPAIYQNSMKNARAGNICSIVGICVSIFMIIFYVCYFIFLFSMMDRFGRLNRY